MPNQLKQEIRKVLRQLVVFRVVAPAIDSSSMSN